MYFYADDLAFAVRLVVHSGTSSDADHIRYVDAFLEFDQRTRAHPAPVFILVAEADGQPPNAKSRERIAEASRNINPKALVVFVSKSTITRRIVTAINWIRPPRYQFTVARDIHDAVEWIEPRRSGIRAIVQRLYVEAKLSADTSSAVTPR